MQYIKPGCYDQFFCVGESCPAQCPAPVDMTWTRTLGALCETGINLACPRAAELLLREDKMTFLRHTDGLAGEEPQGVTAEQLGLMLDARGTMDLLLQERGMELRPRLVLALTYSLDVDPLITAKYRYAYEELDWGFTEQPHRQFQALTQLTGDWELKRSDLCKLLREMQELCEADTVLCGHLKETLKLFDRLSGEEYRRLRDQFDRYMQPREHLFENLMVYYVHRYFLAAAEEKTVAPGAKYMAVSFALLRALCAQIWQKSGSLTDHVFTTLCWHYARCTEEDPEAHAALMKRLMDSPLYSRERLQRLLWQ